MKKKISNVESATWLHGEITMSSPVCDVASTVKLYIIPSKKDY